MDKFTLKSRVNKFFIVFSIFMALLAINLIILNAMELSKGSNLPHILMLILNAVGLLVVVASFIPGLLYNKRETMHLMITGSFFAVTLISLFLTSFLNVSVILGLLISLSLFLLINIDDKPKMIILFSTLAIYFTFTFIKYFKLVDVTLSLEGVERGVVFVSFNIVLFLLFLYTLNLLMLRIKIKDQSEYEKIITDKTLTLDELNEKIYHLNRNLNILETTEKSVFNTTNNIYNENSKIMSYLQEYKMLKRDKPISHAVEKIDKHCSKILQLLEHPIKSGKELEDMHEVILHKKTKILEITKSGYHYEILLKGILFNIILTLMEKLVDDIGTKDVNQEKFGFIDRNEVEEKVFGKVCKNNRLNTNITRIRTLLANEGLTMDLIESKETMIRVKALTNNVSVLDD